MNIKIIGSGSTIPHNVVPNIDFAKNQFLNEDGSPFPQPNEIITEKFKAITGIEERRYADSDQVASDLALEAAQKAIDDAGIDPESLDYIILAHNFGDVKCGAIQSDILPSLASRVKARLKIKNNFCVAYDILFGCPGWIEGMIQAYAFIKAGMARRCMVIGTETLSRVVDPHDRDSMIYADGAGATIVEAHSGSSGMLSYHSASYTLEEAGYLYFGKSFHADHDPDVRYIKMYGRKIYEFALSQVPEGMKVCLDKAAIPIESVKKVLIHQANEKMDEAIIHRFFKKYGQVPPPDIMPMSIHKLGNSSVATVPTLYDLLMKNKLDHHRLEPGDVILFASVGAGMNVNAITYRI